MTLILPYEENAVVTAYAVDTEADADVETEVDYDLEVEVDDLAVIVEVDA